MWETVSESGETANVPPCYYCKHKIKDGGLNPEGYTCAAFPDGVPTLITSRIDRHDTPDVFFGDVVVFEPVEFRGEDGGTYRYSYDGALERKLGY